MLDSKKLEDYFSLRAKCYDSILIPKDAKDIKVTNIKRLAGGMANNVYSLTLQFNNNNATQAFDLVLKGYTEDISLWLKIHHLGEENRRYVREFEAQKALRHSGFSVPEVYFYEDDSFFLGYPFLIMSQEKKTQKSIDVSSLAITLATLHNLEVSKVGIKCLRFPEDNTVFSIERLLCLKLYLDETRHYAFLRRNFDHALDWLNSIVKENTCPKYSIVHGEYHPGHTILSEENTLKVIDWENVQIGDPAFDVGYAYHSIKLMYGSEENSDLGEHAAATFISEYAKHFHGDLSDRLDFYKMVGLLGVAVVVSAYVSSPMKTYKRFGKKALARALIFPLSSSHFVFKKFLKEDFLINYLKYSQDYIKETLKR